MGLSWRDGIDPARAVYRRDGGAGGCCLHIVFEDDNTSENHVRWCLERALKLNHSECEKAATLLLMLSQTQRRKLCANHKEYA